MQTDYRPNDREKFTFYLSIFVRTQPLSHFCSESCLLMVFHFYSFHFPSVLSFPSFSFFNFPPFPFFFPFPFCSVPFPYFSLLSFHFLSFPFPEDPRKGRQLCFPCSLIFPPLSTATCPPVGQHGKAEAEGCRCSTTSGYTTRLVRVFGR